MTKISSPICLNLDNSLLFPIAENNKDKVFNLILKDMEEENE